ncbi:MAG: PDZ domain-containing protein [Candidatus Omnitrophota bacterium]
MNNGEQFKGVVVNEYKDRIILSTTEGEKQIKREEIKDIIFDLEEQNLLKLGDLYLDKNMYEKAEYYYRKALELKPDYRKAGDSLDYVEGLKRTAGFESKRGLIQKLRRDSGQNSHENNSMGSRIKDTLGITLRNVSDTFEIAEVENNSPAKRAGVKQGDILYSVWGRNIKYMEPAEVMEKLLGPGLMEIRVTITRNLMLELGGQGGKYSDLIGAVLDFSEMEGLYFKKIYPGGVADKAGIREGDIISDIQGKPCVYLMLPDIENIINSRKDDTLSLRIKRDVILIKEIGAG